MRDQDADVGVEVIQTEVGADEAAVRRAPGVVDLVAAVAERGLVQLHRAAAMAEAGVAAFVVVEVHELVRGRPGHDATATS